MPFTDIARVPAFEDFGFAFQEGAPNVPFDDAHWHAELLLCGANELLARPAGCCPANLRDVRWTSCARTSPGRGVMEKRRMAAAT
jgi:hypothetical protein